MRKLLPRLSGWRPSPRWVDDVVYGDITLSIDIAYLECFLCDLATTASSEQLLEKRPTWKQSACCHGALK